MMELGSTVCLPRGAKCNACPAAKWCGARGSGRVEMYPPVKRRRESRTIHAASIIIERGGKVLLCRRPAKGLWANMWQCPTLEKAMASAIVEYLQREHGLVVALGEAAGGFAHQTSHRRVMFDVWRATSARGRVRNAQWVALDEIGGFPLSNAQKRVLATGAR